MGFRSLAVVVLGCSLLAAGPATQPAAAKWRVKAGAPPEVAAFFKSAKAQSGKLLRDCRADIDLLEDELKAKQAGAISRSQREDEQTDVKRNGDRWWRFKSADAKRASIEDTKRKIARAEAKLAELTSGPPTAESAGRLEPEAFKAGAIGVIGGLKVVQVVDGSNCLAEARWSGATQLAPGRFQPWDVHKDLWLTGYLTAGLADGDSIKEPILVHVSGTKQFGTAIGGTRTVLLARPFKVEDWIEPAE